MCNGPPVIYAASLQPSYSGISATTLSTLLEAYSLAWKENNAQEVTSETGKREDEP
jgi:hypothetical protein